MIKDIFKPISIETEQLNDHISDYIFNCNGKSSQTIKTYERTLKEFSEYHRRQKNFTFVVSDIQKYKNYLKYKRRMQDHSLVTYLSSLRRFLSFLVDNNVLDKNPAKRIQVKLKDNTNGLSFLRKSEIDKLFNDIGSDNITDRRDNAIICLIIHSALSLREIRALNKNDIVPRKRAWQVILKNSPDERIFLNPETKKAVESYINSVTQFNGAEDTPLFLSNSNRSKNQRMSIRGLRETIKQRLLSCGVRRKGLRLSHYSLHNSAAIRMAANGKSAKDIQRRFKLKLLKTAEKYGDYVREYRL